MPIGSSGHVREITVLTNIPNHHHDYLFDDLRSTGLSVSAAYKGLPASEGRPWDLSPSFPDRVSPNVWADRLHVDHPWAPDSLVILSGSWATPRDWLRRGLALAAGRRGVRAMTWGEAMSGRGGWRGVARSAYFSPFGLEAVLAIGTHAVPSYHDATRGRVPIHVFPYTTSAGLDVPANPPEGQRIIGAVSRLIPYKAIDLLIAAVACLPSADRPRLEIIGSGPLLGALQAQASRLGVDVTFHGERSQEQVNAIRARWSLSVLPSRSLEGWGLTVAEALNQGVPALVSEHVGAADLVRPGESGAVVAAGDVEDPDCWAEHITRLLAADPDEASRRARRVGQAFASGRAARWFADKILPAPSSVEHSFVEDTWRDLSAEVVAGHDAPTTPDGP